MESKLVSRTRELLRSRPHHLKLRKISEDTDIPEGWLKSFGQSKMREPSCPRVEKLYEYLSGEELSI